MTVIAALCSSKLYSNLTQHRPQMCSAVLFMYLYIFSTQFTVLFFHHLLFPVWQEALRVCFGTEQWVLWVGKSQTLPSDQTFLPPPLFSSSSHPPIPFSTCLSSYCRPFLPWAWRRFTAPWELAKSVEMARFFIYLIFFWIMIMSFVFRVRLTWRVQHCSVLFNELY